ncbi:phosphatase PAP2 family protein [Lentilactobacillus kribbianus]|uniref:phosphatase PAP2 family protein n=1 Tax=Lentilactobacillus kribbianus TaxID=2729622 RepID=UPI001556E507|nr:phosphatase PAP2 family protein [Lentilactobacillus kribbianus]
MIIEKDGNRTAKFFVSLIFTVLLAFVVKMNFGYAEFLDSMVVTAVQKSPSGFLNTFYTMVSFLASPTLDIIWIFIIAFFLWGFHYRIPALWSILTLAGADVVGFLVKNVIRRARPIDHLKSDDGFSFPSGHVLGMFIVLAVIWIMVVPLIQSATKQFVLKVIIVMVMILVMMSRVYLNAHYPSDTLGAALVAYTWLLFAENLYPRLAPKLNEWPLIGGNKY